MIKQLQENQLALTEGLDKNRLAITQGFDKMDEVKRWDLDQLPGYEAIKEEEEPEAFEEKYGEEPLYSISYNDIYRIKGREHKINQDDENLVGIRKEDLDKILSEREFDKDKYELKVIDRNKRILKVVEKKLGKRT